MHNNATIMASDETAGVEVELEDQWPDTQNWKLTAETKRTFVFFFLLLFDSNNLMHLQGWQMTAQMKAAVAETPWVKLSSSFLG